MNALEVQRILAAVRAGESDAFAQIVVAYQQDVWRVAAAMLRDFAATENLVQQTFVNAYFNLERFEPGADFGVWIKAIARNAVREELRKKSRADKHLRVYHEQLAARLDASEENAGAEARVEALRRCREHLAPLAARVVSLRYEQARPFEEIARELDRTLEATRQLLNRIRITLRECMERKATHA